jgi:flavin reductase (DIM6/NTAB) family NADH-FMN oxidoreductase RutF
MSSLLQSAEVGTETAQELLTPQVYRSVMGQFATGVTIVTTMDADGKPHGLTVNSFSSLSLDPPLVLWSLRENSTARAHFRAAGHFAINILASGQETASRVFAGAGDRFAAVDWEEGLARVPLIRESLAWIECIRHSELQGGDHTIFTGQVLRARAFKRAPLLYWRGAYFPTET